MNYEMGGTIRCRTVKENDLGVSINANINVSEQCRIAASKGDQIMGMIRINIAYKDNLIVSPYLCIKQYYTSFRILYTGMETVFHE